MNTRGLVTRAPAPCRRSGSRRSRSPI